MTIRHTVKVGQVWESNDPRRLVRVRVANILNGSGLPLNSSHLAAHTIETLAQTRVQVENIITKRRTMLRRDQFTTGTRGWSLVAA